MRLVVSALVKSLTMWHHGILEVGAVCTSSRAETTTIHAGMPLLRTMTSVRVDMQEPILRAKANGQMVSLLRALSRR